MKRLYFVRHGESEGNIAGIFTGGSGPDVPLTSEGRAQAKAAGRSAKNLGIDYIVSSPLGRALETAQIITKEIGYPTNDIHINDLFVERHFGELEGKPWTPDLDIDGIVDIETVDTILERARLAYEFLGTTNAKNILVVSHGAFGRALRSVVLPELYVFEGKLAGGAKNKNYIPNAEILVWVEED